MRLHPHCRRCWLQTSRLLGCVLQILDVVGRGRSELDHIRFRSTQESRIKGEITLLAAIEVVLAMSLAILLSFALSTVNGLLVGALVAPLLLRSPRSNELANRWFANFVGPATRWSKSLTERYEHVKERKRFGFWIAVGVLPRI